MATTMDPLASSRHPPLSSHHERRPRAVGVSLNALNMADYRFRVSDAYFVPLRGWMLRLKLLEGSFDPKSLKPGKSLRLRGPEGEDRVVTVKALGVTGGRQKKERVEDTREFDLVIPPEDAVQDDRPVEIGWEAVPA